MIQGEVYFPFSFSMGCACKSSPRKTVKQVVKRTTQPNKVLRRSMAKSGVRSINKLYNI